MNNSASEKLRKFYGRFSNDDRVLILINADPDAIASAMAVKRLLWRKVASSCIASVNRIKRSDNLAMIKLLGVKINYISEIDPFRFTKYVIVDSQPDHHDCFGLFRPSVVIDHHPETCVFGDFVDIRPTYGATATIMTEYLRAAAIKPSEKLATGLFYAIKTDTGNFGRQTLMKDIEAFQYLFRFANHQLERKIGQTDLPIDFLPYFEKALKEKVIRRHKVYVHLGDVPNPDVCVQIADFFMRLNSMTWSIVSGLFDGKLVIVFRNDGIRRSAGNVASGGFGAYGSAGGHKSMARAEIPVDSLPDCVKLTRKSDVIKWIIKRVTARAGKS
ncbi:DHH family phosphoesterase [Desulforegula conservatrix]|uniref:DHH family phosphoesterase n=1 Tax=Desulforegula conservatrix TaxID=153026 RepID=UPI00041C770E|nr:DHH family phosphoesterase [Desulforegula conservatrix]